MEKATILPNNEFLAALGEAALEVVEEGKIDPLTIQLIQDSLSGRRGSKA